MNRLGTIKRPFEVLDSAIENASMTDKSTVTVVLDLLTITNTTGGALTITVQDKQSTPVAFLSATSIPANSTTVISFGNYGKKFSGGISWQASGAGLKGYMYGQKFPG